MLPKELQAGAAVSGPMQDVTLRVKPCIPCGQSNPQRTIIKSVNILGDMGDGGNIPSVGGIFQSFYVHHSPVCQVS
jgi:hypothetical protein